MNHSKRSRETEPRDMVPSKHQKLIAVVNGHYRLSRKFAQFVIVGLESSGKTSCVTRLFQCSGVIGPNESPFLVNSETGTRSLVTTVIHNNAQAHPHSCRVSFGSTASNNKEVLADTNDLLAAVTVAEGKWASYNNALSLQDEIVLSIFSKDAMSMTIQDTPGLNHNLALKENPAKRLTVELYTKSMRPDPKRKCVMFFVHSMNANTGTNSSLATFLDQASEWENVEVVVILTHLDSTRCSPDSVYASCLTSAEKYRGKNKIRFCLVQPRDSDGKFTTLDKELATLDRFKASISQGKNSTAFMYGFRELKEYMDQKTLESLSKETLDECETELKNDLAGVNSCLSLLKQLAKPGVVTDAMGRLLSRDALSSFDIETDVANLLAKLVKDHCEEHAKLFKLQTYEATPNNSYTVDTPDAVIRARLLAEKREYVSACLYALAERAPDIVSRVMELVSRRLTSELASTLGGPKKFSEEPGKTPIWDRSHLLRSASEKIYSILSGQVSLDLEKSLRQGIINATWLVGATNIKGAKTGTDRSPGSKAQSPEEAALFEGLEHIDYFIELYFRTLIGVAFTSLEAEFSESVNADSDDTSKKDAAEIAKLEAEGKDIGKNIEAIKELRNVIPQGSSRSWFGSVLKPLGW